MTRKSLGLWLMLGVLLAIYLVFFHTWNSPDNIRIIRQARPGRSNTLERDPASAPVYAVSFGFDQKYRFTSIKVVAAQDLATNKYPQALWHLVADTQSAPIKALVYGNDIKGMKPSVPGRVAEPLEANVEYVLLLETKAGLKGRTNFTAQVARSTQ